MHVIEDHQAFPALCRQIHRVIALPRQAEMSEAETRRRSPAYEFARRVRLPTGACRARGMSASDSGQVNQALVQTVGNSIPRHRSRVFALTLTFLRSSACMLPRRAGGWVASGLPGLGPPGTVHDAWRTPRPVCHQKKWSRAAIQPREPCSTAACASSAWSSSRGRRRANCFTTAPTGQAKKAETAAWPSSPRASSPASHAPHNP